MVLLRMERDSQGAELAALQAEVTAREEALAALRHKVEELEGRDPIRLALTGREVPGAWLGRCMHG